MNKRLFVYLTAFIAFTLCQISQTNLQARVQKETFTYAVKDGEELKLDTYFESETTLGEKMPVFIYIFGGSWETGSKENGAQIAQFFAKQGFLGVSINYRLGIKKYKKDHNLPEQGYPDSEHFAEAYSYAIDLGVEDLFDATSFIIGNAEKWNIDPEKIIICGSSAGAINSVTAEWMISNEMPLAKNHLPEGFNYAGVISQAGGVWKRGSEEPQWKNAPCPVLFFHGNKDQLVPYSASTQADFGAFGGGYLKGEFAKNKFPYYAVTVNDADHMIAVLPQNTSLYEMMSFYSRFVKGGQKIGVEVTETYYDKAPSMANLYGQRR